MIDFASLILAFTAGVFTVFSPCSFPLLPGYFIYRLTVSSSSKQTIFAGFICALGLISVFLALAVLLSLAGAFLSFYVSAMPLIAGVLMMVMGAAMLVGKGFSHSPFVTLSGKKDGVIGTFGYGITYGFASTGCSAPVFYSLVFYSLASKSFSEGVVVFSAYALGIGLPLVVISVLVGLGRGALLHKFSKITPVLHRISGILLMSFGLYQICRYLLTQ